MTETISLIKEGWVKLAEADPISRGDGFVLVPGDPDYVPRLRIYLEVSTSTLLICLDDKQEDATACFSNETAIRRAIEVIDGWRQKRAEVLERLKEVRRQHLKDKEEEPDIPF